MRNITDMIRNGGLNDTIGKYVNGSQRPTNLPFDSSNMNRAQKPLPKIRVSIKINPYNSTFYQTVRLEAIIK